MKFGKYRLISGHNIDKKDIFIQRNQNFKELMFSLSSLVPQTKVKVTPKHYACVLFYSNIFFDIFDIFFTPTILDLNIVLAIVQFGLKKLEKWYNLQMSIFRITIIVTNNDQNNN